MNTPNVSIFTALIAGLLAFFSPCVLPLVPAYLGYMAGTTVSGLASTSRWRIALHALVFTLGFGLVFTLLGAAAGLLGSALGRYLPAVVRIGGVFLIILGLDLLGLVRIPFLQMERRLEVRPKRSGYWASFLVGMVFAAGWTPCIGPVLASILVLAANSQTVWQGSLLLAVFSLGLGVPFIAVGALFHVLLPLMRRMGKWVRIFNYVGGGLLIVMGFLLLTGLFSQISFYMDQFAAGPVLAFGFSSTIMASYGA
ncbi:MAG: cytochrome c biogenesis protein CcdA [Chloroflexi bacterium]|nr:cytochrome c biogenesis protein CcdA [Chloroflexota bacterium]